MAEFSIHRLSADDDRGSFDCGDKDLNEFLEQDSRTGFSLLMSVTYAVKRQHALAAFFCVSNDAIKKEDVPRSTYERLTKILPKGKRYSTMPAVKIGRFAVAKEFQRTGLGTSILYFIKGWFTELNKTGCRFLIVDSYQKAIPFYERNGFSFLSRRDERDETRIMYFDLITVIQAMKHAHHDTVPSGFLPPATGA